MKITIDEKQCHKHKLSIEEFLVTLTIRTVKSIREVKENLKNREVIVNRGPNNDLLVTQHWSDVLDEILADSLKVEGIDDGRLLNLAQQMRELYPKGKMKDRFGRETPYYFRCNNSEVVKALKRFITQRGNYSDDEILDATRRYVAAHSRTNYSSMRLIKYFILKDEKKEDDEGNVKVNQVSDLETFLENKESEGEVGEVNNDDWTTKIV